MCGPVVISAGRGECSENRIIKLPCSVILNFWINYPVNARLAFNNCLCLFRSVGLKLTLDDFQKVSDKVPFLADLKPSGKYVMEDLHMVKAQI